MNLQRDEKLNAPKTGFTLDPELNNLDTLSTRFSILLSLLAIVFVLPTKLSAQNPRLELGRRLKRFEVSWETSTPTQRVQAVPFLQKAVRNFFSLSLLEAGREMDLAWLALNPQKKLNTLTNATIGSQLLVSPVCADTEADSLAIQLTTFYSTEQEVNPETRAELTLTDQEGHQLAEMQVPLHEISQGTSWKLPDLADGDYTIALTLMQSDNTFTLPPVMFSRIEALDHRLERLEESAATFKIGPETTNTSTFEQTLAATARHESRFFRNLLDGLSQEADFPYSERLKNCELLLASKDNPREIFNEKRRAHESWISLANGTRSVPTRIHLPSSSDAPLPVLFVLHGAGGSENMFFETYGAGRVISEAAERSWIVVSPRQGLFGLPLDINQMLIALEDIAPIDRKRIMLIGHSMGAAQVIQQVRSNPSLPIAAVALGGGGRLSKNDGQRSQSVAWYIGAGSQDFGLSSAKQLNQSLIESDNEVRFKIYQNVEHLVVVQAAIDDSFAFLDEVLTNQQNRSDNP